MVPVLSLMAVLAAAPAAAPCNETEHTEASLRCVADHWGRAFVSGDRAYLESLLSPGYFSYKATGEARDKATVLELSQKYAQAHPEAAAQPMPPSPPGEIQLRGEVAVIFWKNADHTLGSVDAYFWAEHRWHAWYSQHAKG